ncbi:hypothetical protein HZS92_03069 [Xanthomonas citri pv. citri]|nr:hypothetical protein HZS92_03069 [Xanthomonas citri pv. citri]QYF45766.1 hypothetical protein HZS93_03095 [Xanthomonas citri]
MVVAISSDALAIRIAQTSKAPLINAATILVPSKAACESVSATPATATTTGRATASAAVNHNCVAIGRRCDMTVASWGQVTTNDGSDRSDGAGVQAASASWLGCNC